MHEGLFLLKPSVACHTMTLSEAWQAKKALKELSCPTSSVTSCSDIADRRYMWRQCFVVRWCLDASNVTSLYDVITWQSELGKSELMIGVVWNFSSSTGQCLEWDTFRILALLHCGLLHLARSLIFNFITRYNTKCAAGLYLWVLQRA